ncbi:MAG: HsdM family class I SAM-dependent methyltransferase [Ktedonobacteraceae bacterium]
MAIAPPNKLLADTPSLRAFIAETRFVLGALVQAAQACLHTALHEIEAAEHSLPPTEIQHIQNAYQMWLACHKCMEGENKSVEEAHWQKFFAEQVGYVFFVRLLLARVLEDKGIMPRLVSDGGFKRWSEFLKTSYLDNLTEIRGETFLSLVYRRVTGFYRHFFQQPVFDWFVPDDSLLALVLSRLNQYNFNDVSNDLLGFTYEAFIERVARNQKGHFLTPPEVVEFMLDRAGYASRAIIGENLIDLSCGSGSFLVHAARRLKTAISDALVEASPLERAHIFIELVQTKLVGLEINPFSCYLAELNLFIQILDDLVLLWNSGERPNIECFAIYNTNSLEMPPAVLQSTYGTTATTAIDEEATALDEAAPIKAKQKAFTYILCNPPYVNRGIIAGSKSYGEYPFYREVVKGDENFYLLFLRLAVYYSAPGGTICFICPLNLLGDESTTRTREMFKRIADWSLRSITRFYTRTVLFPGVLQGVCVIRIDQTPVHPIDSIEIRGGFSIAEASQHSTSITYRRIVANYPAKATWSKPWLVNADPATYHMWEFIQHSCQQELGELIADKMSTAKGDVRSTWAKPLLAATHGSQTVPLTKGEKIIDWGDWSAAAYLNPSLTIPSTVPNYKSTLWVQKNIRRIVNLIQPETVLLLKEVSGLEMKRPIRGTITQRSASQPLVADETALVLYTLDTAHENLAYALFGLITSTLYNFLFSLFSTNAHANFKEIQRLPVPVWSTALEMRLAGMTQDVLQAYHDLHEHEKAFGKEQHGHININTTLITSGLPTIRLEELILRGAITLNGPHTHALAILLKRGQITFDIQLSHEARIAIEHVIQANTTLSYSKGGKNLLVPNSRVAAAFLTQLEQRASERQQKIQQTAQQQNILDRQVIEAYGIRTPAWKSLVSVGVPWARD